MRCSCVYCLCLACRISSSTQLLEQSPNHRPQPVSEAVRDREFLRRHVGGVWFEPAGARVGDDKHNIVHRGSIQLANDFLQRILEARRQLSFVGLQQQHYGVDLDEVADMIYNIVQRYFVEMNALCVVNARGVDHSNFGRAIGESVRCRELREGIAKIVCLQDIADLNQFHLALLGADLEFDGGRAKIQSWISKQKTAMKSLMTVIFQMTRDYNVLH